MPRTTTQTPDVMTTPNRPSGRADLPHTPISAPPAHNRTDSHTEPKSALLRHALEAKRAAHSTPTPTPTDTSHVHPQTLDDMGSDPWLDTAKDEDTMRATPVRRPRRPSEGAFPRVRPQRELQAENDSLKKVQMDLKIRLEALGDQHKKLQDKADAYMERIRELEPCAFEIHDLRVANNELTSKMKTMEDELVDLREHNQVVLKISEETVLEMGKRNEALEEAAELIHGLETDNAAMSEEIRQFKAQAAEAHRSDKNDSDTLSVADSQAHRSEKYNPDALLMADGQAKYPTRVHSIDESRPSTSYNDSDYFSMPASPHAKPSHGSMTAVSERAKKFINMKQESQRSTKDLSRRLSNASLKRPKKKKQEPVPKVPQIPGAYQKDSIVRATTLSPALAYDPYGISQSGSASQTPTGGLRGQFENSLTLDTSSRHSRPNSQRSDTTNNSLTTKCKQPKRTPEAPVAPARHSSRAAHTSYSAEQLVTERKPDEQSEAGTESTWEVPSTVASTELDVNYRGPWYNQISSWGTKIGTGGAETAQRAPSYTEANFLFNPAENEDEFVEKTRSLGRRR